MKKLTLPEAVKGMMSGTIMAWLKRPGDAVAAGDALAKVQAKRDIFIVQSPAAGRLGEIAAPQGATVGVGEPIAMLAGEGETAAPAASAQKTPEQGRPAAPPAAPAGVVPILMPKAGNSMEEGTIVSWKVKEGERINKGQILFEVETDKAVVEVEADVAGRLAKIIVGEGQTIAVLQPVAYLAEDDGAVANFLSAHGAAAAQGGAGQAAPAKQPSPVAAQAAAPAWTGTPGREGRPKASPAARKLANERGVDLLAMASGSGPGGRILSPDVAAAVATGAAPAAPAPAVEGVVFRPLGRMRKSIAKNLTLSKQTVPHFYIELTINAGPMMDFYRQEKAKYPLSVNDVLIRACGQALMEFPAFRRRLEGDQYAEYPSANIGMAVAMEDGLVVPVVVGVEKMNLEELGRQTAKLAQAARGGRIETAAPAVMTISNLGMFGTERFSAIINPPEASILAVGAVREEPVVSEGKIIPARRLTMTLSCDHRVVDGVIAAKFLARLKELLEQPAAG